MFVSARGLVAGAFAVALLTALAASPACITIGDPPEDAGADASGTKCGNERCDDSRVCAYRECTEKERCVPRPTCPAGTTPADCSGQPGCISPTCGPVVLGCRDVPAACDGGAACACDQICGGAAACVKVDGKSVLCKGS